MQRRAGPIRCSRSICDSHSSPRPPLRTAGPIPPPPSHVQARARAVGAPPRQLPRRQPRGPGVLKRARRPPVAAWGVAPDQRPRLHGQRGDERDPGVPRSPGRRVPVGPCVAVRVGAPPPALVLVELGELGGGEAHGVTCSASAMRAWASVGPRACSAPAVSAYQTPPTRWGTHRIDTGPHASSDTRAMRQPRVAGS